MKENPECPEWPKNIFLMRSHAPTPSACIRANTGPQLLIGGVAVDAPVDAPLSSELPVAYAAPMVGASVAVTYLDGEPEGLRMTTAAYRTVRAYAVPRSSLLHFRTLPGANTAGLYLLWGEHPDAEWRRQAYVGKTLSLRNRLAEHSRSEGWWSEALVVASPPHGVLASCLAHLERDFILAGRSIAEVCLTNAILPEPPPLPESGEADIDFLRAALVRLLPPLGPEACRFVRALRRQRVKQSTGPFQYRPNGAAASLERVAGTCRVLAGSTVVTRCMPSPSATGRERRATFEATGVLELAGEVCNVRRDIEFSSPSAAASFVAGSPQNGRRCWCLPDGTSLGDVDDVGT